MRICNIKILNNQKHDEKVYQIYVVHFAVWIAILRGNMQHTTLYLSVADLTVGGLGGRLGPRRFRGPVDR